LWRVCGGAARAVCPGHPIGLLIPANAELSLLVAWHLNYSLFPLQACGAGLPATIKSIDVIHRVKTGGKRTGLVDIHEDA
jgi:hypothetical protein